MSVLTCPVCRGAMREVAHLGVAIDTCTNCRGVWLDRGELEKIAAIIGSSGLTGAPAAPAYAAVGRAGPVPGAVPYRRRDDDDEDDDDDDDDRRRRGQPQQRKRSSFLDFFD